MADYAAYYGGPPAPGDSWPLFLALVRRTPTHQARREHTATVGAILAIASAFGGEETGAEREALLRRAYPIKGKASPVEIENLFGKGHDA